MITLEEAQSYGARIKAGETVSSIAAELGYNISTFRRQLRRFNMPTRRDTFLLTEREIYVKLVVNDCQGNQAEAARYLVVSRQYVNQVMSK